MRSVKNLYGKKSEAILFFNLSLTTNDKYCISYLFIYKRFQLLFLFIHSQIFSFCKLSYSTYILPVSSCLQLFSLSKFCMVCFNKSNSVTALEIYIIFTVHLNSYSHLYILFSLEQISSLKDCDHGHKFLECADMKICLINNRFLKFW